ncbi:uncharacterized protein GIQ15_00369 [Arthroderma uncinatum]|uniref:uncharacterized protein n=1 Tax=Arthroderma uncinatum TaxID=74035 RepID=UPI00144AE466|nr:uncharacterized protein GIQ15_00369 [Arthroderma uncinatum]KAF3490852.1 hypothetical protein GIQ15_00369 [Arthroderma uncinatum]
MKFSQAVVALAAASVATAQGLPDVPPCSLSCFVEALGGDGCSELTDFKCHCSKPELPGKITPCVKAACPIEDQIIVSKAVVKQCSQAGNPISIPPVEESSSAPASTSEAPTASPTESTPAPSTTAAPTGTGSPSGTGAPGGPSGTGTFTNTGVPTQSTPIYTGAASGLAANVGDQIKSTNAWWMVNVVVCVPVYTVSISCQFDLEEELDLVDLDLEQGARIPGHSPHTVYITTHVYTWDRRYINQDGSPVTRELYLIDRLRIVLNALLVVVHSLGQDASRYDLRMPSELGLTDSDLGVHYLQPIVAVWIGEVEVASYQNWLQLAGGGTRRKATGRETRRFHSDRSLLKYSLCKLHRQAGICKLSHTFNRIHVAPQAANSELEGRATCKIYLQTLQTVQTVQTAEMDRHERYRYEAGLEMPTLIPTDAFPEAYTASTVPFPINVAGEPRRNDVVIALPWDCIHRIFQEVILLEDLSEIPRHIREAQARESWGQVVKLMGVNRAWYSLVRGALISMPMAAILDNCPEKWALKSLDINLTHLRQCNHPATMYTNGLSNVKKLPYDHPAVRATVMDLLPRAVARQFHKCTQMLVRAGANISARDKLGYSCLYIAVDQGWHMGLIWLLEEHTGHNLDIDNPTAAALAMLKEDRLSFASLINSGGKLDSRFRYRGKLFTLPTFMATHATGTMIHSMTQRGLKDDLPDDHPDNLIMICLRVDNTGLLLTLLSCGWMVDHVAAELERRGWSCSERAKAHLVHFRMWPSRAPPILRWVA